MGISSTAKSTFGIGTTVAAVTATQFAADTYVEVNNIEDLGEAGSQAEVLVGKYIGQTHVRKIKGSRDNGSMTLVIGRDATDPGYLALIAAEASDHAFNFCVTLNDAPAVGASPEPSRFYFKAIVASARTQFGGADDITKTTFELAISGAVIEVPASAS